MANQPVIIVSGASGGIGSATARLFGQMGYRVVLAARNLEKLKHIEAEIISHGGVAKAIKTDITQFGSIMNMVEITINQYQQIDVLFNNAGIGRLGWLERLDQQDDIQNQLQSNLLGAVWMTRAVLPYMIERRSGHIINMISVAGLIATPTYSIYSASKFGMRGFTDALRREVHYHGIHVSAIYPGGVKTGFAHEAVSRRKTGLRTPKWLVLSAEDVARAVYSLVRRPRRMVIIPWPNRLVWWLTLMFPGLVDKLVERFFVRLERK
jgi:short-subunit dehydrogenase